MIGTKIGKYELREKRGEGGFGVLYKAFDTVIEREIALKLLHRQFAADEKFSAWFHREAKAMAKLNHPNIVTIYNFEIVDDNHFIVMEYIEGDNVDEILRKRGPCGVGDMIMISRQLLSALGYAHKNGIIHRDIKPSNIMVTGSGLVKITDFGIAKILGSSKLTQTGTAAGSLPYMSPEQIRGKGLDHRSDLYSLGITLFQMLTGEVPFKEESDFLLMQAHLEKPPPNPSGLRDDIPMGLEKVLLKALEKDAQSRYSSAVEMSQALVKVMNDSGLDKEVSDEYTLVSEAIDNSSSDKTEIVAGEHDRTELKLPPKKGPRPIFYIIGVIIVVVAGLVLVQTLTKSSDTETTTQESTPIDTQETPIIADDDTQEDIVQDESSESVQDQQESQNPQYSGKLEINYTPFDYSKKAEVFVSGIKIPHNQMPINLDTLKPGRHTVLLVWEDVRFFDTITISEQSRLRDYNFLGPLGEVRVSATFIGGSPNQWGEIYIDDVRQEAGTPSQFELVEGPHKISVMKAGYETVGGYKIANVKGDTDVSWVEPYIDLNFKLRKK